MAVLSNIRQGLCTEINTTTYKRDTVGEYFRPVYVDSEVRFPSPVTETSLVRSGPRRRTLTPEESVSSSDLRHDLRPRPPFRDTLHRKYPPVFLPAFFRVPRPPTSVRNGNKRSSPHVPGDHRQSLPRFIYVNFLETLHLDTPQSLVLPYSVLETTRTHLTCGGPGGATETSTVGPVWDVGATVPTLEPLNLNLD